ncbi:DUF4124 domain-containing protein (plasmid) [Cupriavidus necator]|nr:DUF4124 domain-containing protein [Cupriavidus necator]
MATNAAGQTIYQCRSTAGRVTLQDSPCPSDARTEVERKSIGQRNAEYRSEPTSFFDPTRQARLTSSIICPSLRQSYQAAVASSERALLTQYPGRSSKHQKLYNEPGHKYQSIGASERINPQRDRTAVLRGRLLLDRRWPRTTYETSACFEVGGRFGMRS